MGKFSKDTLITFLARVCQIILGIGSSVIIARSLGPEGKGIYSLAILLQGFLISFTDFGIGSASVFYIGRKKYPPNEIFGMNIILSVLISVFATILGVIIICFFGNKIFPTVPIEYLFLALFLILPQFFLNFVVNILLGLQKIKKYNFIQLGASFLFLALVTFFMLGHRLSVKTAIIAQLISYFIICIVLFFQTKRETNGLLFLLNKNIFKDFFSYGIKNYLGNIFSIFHYRIDMFLVNIFLNPIATGFYSIAVGVAEQVWIVSFAAGTVLFPRVSSETNEKNLKEFTPLVCRNILFVTSLVAIFLFMIGRNLIILLYSEEFFNSILPFQILLIGTVTISAWRILSNDLYGRGKPMLNTYITASALILNIILNIAWIPKFGIAGAAWATSISYTFSLVVTARVYGKISGNKITDIIFIKKSDFKIYYNFIHSLRYKYFPLRKIS